MVHQLPIALIPIRQESREKVQRTYRETHGDWEVLLRSIPQGCRGSGSERRNSGVESIVDVNRKAMVGSFGGHCRLKLGDGG